MKQYSIHLKSAAKLLSVCMAIVLIATTFYYNSPESQASTVSFVILSKYKNTLKIGQSFRLVGVATSGKTVKWKSSKSSVASVNTYGLVTAKKSGTCKITGKVSGAEASCEVTVLSTEIKLNAATVTLENGASFQLKASVSSGSEVTWKSSKSSVVMIEDNGKIYAQKVGQAVITASADGTKKTCKVTVKKPKVTLSQTSLTLAPEKSCKLTAKVSSGRTPVWKSKKSSVASVDDEGTVTALKEGFTIISCTVDGVKKECTVTVKK
jgi:uncharacterized protein YjdB